MTTSAIQIGLDPGVVDHDSPDFAQFGGLTAETVRTVLDDDIALLRAAGYDVDGCPVDEGPEATPDDIRRWHPDPELPVS